MSITIPRSLCCVFAATLVSLTVSAQQSWTLTQCIDHALTHNISVKQYENLQRQQEIQLSTAKNQQLPDLSASAGQNFSFGRGLTSQNTYTNTNTHSTSFSLGTSIPLFTGFRIANSIKLSQLNLKASTADLEKARNDIRIQVAQAYVQILYNMEISDVARRQITIDSAQVDRLQKILEQGRVSEAELSQQKASLAQSQLVATQADNNTRLSLLTLSQLLELDSPDNFTIVRPDTAQLISRSVDCDSAAAPVSTSVCRGSAATPMAIPTPDVIFSEAVAIRPEIEAGDLRLKIADKNISLAKASLYPQLNLSAGMGSNYYKTSGFTADPFSTQMKNNFSQYVGLSLSFSIFNRFQTRNNIRSARIDYQNQQLALDNTRKQLYKEIQQAYYNTIAAQQKLSSCQQAEQSAAHAFRLMTAKYEQGKANITEFNESKNNYLKTQSDLTQARYEYLYQTALIQFYRGQQLKF